MKSFKDAVAQYSKRSDGGTLVTKPTYPGSVWKPKWSGKGEARMETHVRFTGPMTEDRKNFMPCRYGPEDNEFGNWLVCAPVFTGGTTEQFSFIAGLEDPNSPGDIMDLTMNPSPAAEFQLHAKRMANSDPMLKNILLEGGKGRRAALPKRLESCAFAQGVIFQHGTLNYYKRPQSPVLFFMSPGACLALQDALNKKVENYTGDPLDLKSRFAAGDILDANSGCVLSFYNALSGTATPEQTAVDWNKAGSTVGKQQAEEFSHYACEVKSRVSIPKDANGQLINLAGKPLFTPWSDVIRFLDVKEQVEILCRAYADLPVLLRDCLRTYSDYLPNFVRGNATVTVNGNKPVPHPYINQPPVTSAPNQQTAPSNEPAIDWGNACGPEDNGPELKAAIDAGLVAPSNVGGAQSQPAQTVLASNDPRINAAKARLAALQTSVK